MPVQGQKVTRKNVLAWASGHFQRVWAQKVMFAGAGGHFQCVRAQKVRSLSRLICSDPHYKFFNCAHW